MSRDYSIDIILDVIPCRESMKTILIRGEELNIRYLNHNDSIEDPATFLPVEDALDTILNALYQPSNNDDLPVIILKISDTYCLLVFEKSQAYISMLLSPHAYIWTKNNDPNQPIDFDRYIRFVLDLCKDFCIIELKTFDSYRDG